MPTWNEGHFTGQKPPLKPSEVWSIRTRLQVSGANRDLALFNLAIDSKLRGCDLVAMCVGDVARSGCVRDRTVVIPRKTGRPVQFEITEQTRQALTDWITAQRLQEGDFLFPSRFRGTPHISTQQYARIVDRWTSSIGLDPKRYGTHSLRRTKASLRTLVRSHVNRCHPGGRVGCELRLRRGRILRDVASRRAAGDRSVMIRIRQMNG